MTNPSEAGVLAVIGSHLSQLCVETPEDQAHFDSMREARATIAEYIAANEEYDAARRIHDALQDGVSTIGKVGFAEAGLRRAKERRAAAHAAMLGVVS